MRGMTTSVTSKNNTLLNQLKKYVKKISFSCKFYPEMVEHSKELPETNGVTNHFESTRFILTSHATSVKCGGLYILQQNITSQP